jgi:hypothetical protein
MTHFQNTARQGPEQGPRQGCRVDLAFLPSLLRRQRTYDNRPPRLDHAFINTTPVPHSLLVPSLLHSPLDAACRGWCVRKRVAELVHSPGKWAAAGGASESPALRCALRSLRGRLITFSLWAMAKQGRARLLPSRSAGSACNLPCGSAGASPSQGFAPLPRPRCPVSLGADSQPFGGHRPTH